MCERGCVEGDVWRGMCKGVSSTIVQRVEGCVHVWR